MHLGYHELRKMLEDFQRKRQERQMAPPAARAAPSLAPPSAPSAPRPVDPRTDYRSSRDDYRERERYDRGGERGGAAPSGRYE